MILLVVDSMERHRFFYRLACSLQKEGRHVVFLVSEPLSYLLLKNKGFSAYYPSRFFSGNKKINIDAEEKIKFSIEVVNEVIPSERAISDYFSVYSLLEKIIGELNINRVLMWNGQQLICRAITEACRLNHVDLGFFEISNLPNKLFYDPAGVNALSDLAKHPELLDKYDEITDEFHENWMSLYEAYKARPIPQSVKSMRSKLLSFFNYLLKYLSFGVGRVNFEFLKKNKKLLIPKSKFSSISSDELNSIRYIFLPLQVSGDTQVKLHSDFDNLGAINFANTLAKEHGLKLLVKVHPAENNSTHLDKILKLMDDLKFEMVNVGTIDLIKSSELIVTINSTVGLEAMLYQKNLIVLGRCFYKSFDRSRLLKYIHKFLIDRVDYFGSDDIPDEACMRIFEIVGNRDV
ncbi:capsular polysaccharide export protein, LipB/KpsS family [Quatrionicoccus australiensis]|uniref:capsular polysaccharide export protein, LipB/KpsS family n=1 Tax=Quatrionicoccus australiensis TaxID=138118 RepID=UPI001CFBBB9C|nr:hypothetical protein [Quatrionicoccus australiensis]MCB4358672.1 hypothetical protein [Quatrionicoccus australiensis]